MDTKNQNKSAIQIAFEKFGNNKATAKNIAKWKIQKWDFHPPSVPIR
jgi:hypothetical protein